MNAKETTSFSSDQSGVTAVEFALIIPAFLALLVGIIQSAVLLFSIASLDYATQGAARCAAVNAAQCGDPSGISSFGRSSFYAPGIPTFTYAAAACGNSVTGTLNFDFNVVIFSKSIALSSSACFP